MRRHIQAWNCQYVGSHCRSTAQRSAQSPPRRYKKHSDPGPHTRQSAIHADYVPQLSASSKAFSTTSVRAG